MILEASRSLLSSKGAHRPREARKPSLLEAGRDASHHHAEASPANLTRRCLLSTLPVLAYSLLTIPRPAAADVLEPLTSIPPQRVPQDTPTPADSSNSAPQQPAPQPINPAPSSDPSSLAPQFFEDEEYTYLAPGSFAYVEIPVPKVDRGPAPERNPLRSRFEAQEPGGEASISVVVRNAQALTFTLLQVSDITALGPLDKAASLLLPKGSTLLSSSEETIDVPPRVTPVGEVVLPPKTYYRYEFITREGQRIAMSAAAARGKVYVCGGATPKTQWKTYGPELTRTAKSFRIKETVGIGRK